MADYRFDAQAIKDIEQLYAYLLRRDERAADRMLDALYDKFAQLGNFPEWGATRADLSPAIRCVTVPPYVVYYCIGVRDVVILRVLHGSRNADQIFRSE